MPTPLVQIISTHAYEEIVSKVKENVGEEASKYILPGVFKALEDGSVFVRKSSTGGSMWSPCACAPVVGLSWRSLPNGASIKLTLWSISSNLMPHATSMNYLQRNAKSLSNRLLFDAILVGQSGTSLSPIHIIP